MSLRPQQGRAPGAQAVPGSTSNVSRLAQVLAVGMKLRPVDADTAAGARARKKKALSAPRPHWNFAVLRLADTHIEAYDGNESESFLTTFARYRFYEAALEGDFDYVDAILERVDGRYIALRYGPGGSVYDTSLVTVLTKDEKLNDEVLQIVKKHTEDYFKDLRIRSFADVEALTSDDAPRYIDIARDISAALTRSFFKEAANGTFVLEFPDDGIIEWDDEDAFSKGFFFKPGDDDDYTERVMYDVAYVRMMGKGE